MRVLVAYGSKRGGTAGLAEMVVNALRVRGLDAVAQPARDVKSVDGFDGVIVGGSLYANRWHKDARRFVRRFARSLSGRPVWLFASGPLDDSARESALPPVRQVSDAATTLAARGQVTFGGRLSSDARGFPASAMAKTRAGDWRDPTHVDEWVSEIAAALGAAPASSS